MEPLLHFTIPFVLLMLMGVEIKKALPISVIALIPDLDALFHVHRSTSHSIMIPIAVATLLLLPRRVYSRNFIALALLTASSHSIVDLFTGYTPIFWPLCSYSIWLQIGLAAHIGSSPSLNLSGQLLVKPTSFQAFQSLDTPLFTGEGLIVSMMMLSPLLLRALRMSNLKVKRVWSFGRGGWSTSLGDVVLWRSRLARVGGFITGMTPRFKIPDKALKLG